MHVEERFVRDGWRVWAGWLLLLVLAFLVAVSVTAPSPVVGSTAVVAGLLLGAGMETAQHQTAVGRRLRRGYAARSRRTRGLFVFLTTAALMFGVPDRWIEPHASVLLPGLVAVLAGGLVVQTVHLFEVA
jgi:hypothetical protein